MIKLCLQQAGHETGSLQALASYTLGLATIYIHVLDY